MGVTIKQDEWWFSSFFCLYFYAFFCHLCPTVHFSTRCYILVCRDTVCLTLQSAQKLTWFVKAVWIFIVDNFKENCLWSKAWYSLDFIRDLNTIWKVHKSDRGWYSYVCNKNATLWDRLSKTFLNSGLHDDLEQRSWARLVLSRMVWVPVHKTQETGSSSESIYHVVVRKWKYGAREQKK